MTNFNFIEMKNVIQIKKKHKFLKKIVEYINF